MKLKKKIMMNEELFQDLEKIKISHPVKNRDRKPAGKKLKAFIIFLYVISIILLYIGITIPVNTQTSLSAILFNNKKWIVLEMAGLFNFIINIFLEPSIKKDSKILFPQLIFSLIFILVMVLFVLPHFIFNAKNPIIGIFYFVEILLIMVIVLTGQNLLDLFIS